MQIMLTVCKYEFILVKLEFTSEGVKRASIGADAQTVVPFDGWVS